MCGICGWVRLQGDGPPPETLETMCQTLYHRGPDEQGIFQNNEVALSIRRLSIIDVAGGQQPYSNEDGTVVVVFNGEIYNFQEIREQLEARGHRFKTRADGEVIAHLYEEKGPDLVHSLNGMFAIALWDDKIKRCLLIRDRLGIKPLYYGVSQGTLYFGSELKAILAAPDFPRRLDRDALLTYLTLEYVPGPLSILTDIRKLPPAHWTWVEETPKPQRYWRPQLRPSPHGSLSEWGERVRSALKESVKRRLIADVPLGVFLSGGLDSSSVTALMTELSSGKVKSFSVGFHEGSYDESRFFREVAQALGTDHHDQLLEPDSALQLLDPLMDVLDEPLADAAILPTMLLSRFARQHVTVCLAGEGADEILGGYPTYFAHQVADRLDWLPHALVLWLRRLADLLPTSTAYLSLDFRIKKFVSGLGRQRLERHLTWMGSLPPEVAPEFIMRPGGRGALAILERLQPELEQLRGTEQIQMLDLHTYLADQLLVKLDRATMAASLEGRVPFLDHEFLEAVAELPSRHKLKGLNAKLALKQAMAQSLPSSVTGRPKKGFGIPVNRWMKNELRPLLEQHLNGDYLRTQGVFEPVPIQRLVSEHLSGRADHRKPLWTLLVFQMWFARIRPSV